TGGAVRLRRGARGRACAPRGRHCRGGSRLGRPPSGRRGDRHGRPGTAPGRRGPQNGDRHVAMTVPLPPVTLPRFPLATLPTPLVRARRLERVLGGRLLVKRADLTGFGAAGNKARQLEYLVGAAVAEQRDVLVTGGGPGSNFCPAAAGAARAAGMECTLVVYGDPPAVLPPNLALARACGARLRFTGAGRDLVD